LKIALEDIQLIPTSPLLQRLFEIEKFDPEESDQLIERVEIPVTSGSAQAPDVARTEALLAFDAVRTTKRTPLEMDIGVDVHVEGRPSASTIDDLSRVEQRLLAEAFDAVGSKEVSSSSLSFLPPWVIEKAVETERQNYMNVVEKTSYAQAGPHANVLSTHSILKIKFEDGSYRLKCRLVPHGNRDEGKKCIAKRLLYCQKLGHPSSSGYRDAAQVFCGFNRCRRRLPAIWSSASASFCTSTSRMG
jgi:hypothetical protein